MHRCGGCGKCLASSKAGPPIVVGVPVGQDPITGTEKSRAGEELRGWSSPEAAEAAAAAAAAAEDAEAAAKSTRAVKLAFFGIYGSESGTEGEVKSPGVTFLRPPRACLVCVERRKFSKPDGGAGSPLEAKKQRVSFSLPCGGGRAPVRLPSLPCGGRGPSSSSSSGQADGGYLSSSYLAEMLGSATEMLGCTSVRSKAPTPALQMQPEAPPPARRPSQQKVGIEQRLEEALAAGEARGAEFYEKS